MIYSNFFKGIGRSKYETGTFTKLDNCDVFDELGTLRCNTKIVKEASIVDEPCYQATDFNGNVWLFSKTSGKVWKRDTLGSYTLEHTNTNGAHKNAFFSVVIGILVYVSGDKVGAYDFTTWNDTIGTLDAGQGIAPICELNRRVFIGDKNYIASYDRFGTFQPQALDIYTRYTATSLTADRTFLLVGAQIQNATQQSHVFAWDTRAQSWTYDDFVWEKNINFWIPSDNIAYALAGDGIYYWNGAEMVLFRTFPEEVVTDSPQHVTAVAGRPYFVVGDSVYTIHKPAEGYDYGIVKEFTAPENILSIGNSQEKLIVTTENGIYVEGTLPETATIETALDNDVSRGLVYVVYESMNGGNITLETNVNQNGWVQEKNFINDETNKRFELVGGFSTDQKVQNVQVRVNISADEDTPIIRGIAIS